jgi:hypothetical protein
MSYKEKSGMLNFQLRRYKPSIKVTSIILLIINAIGCSDQNNTVASIPAIEFINQNETYNPESVIPPQCYTKTDSIHNPCYVCHQTYSSSDGSPRPNMMSDGDLQGQYDFSDVGLHNSWKNLFVDRTEMIEKISDEEISAWVETDNYQEFIENLEDNSEWKGEIPKLNNLAYPVKAFASNGIALDGSHWVAFNYKPFPSTFWPTNGSTGDVMIRLDKVFREDKGKYSQDVYFTNLALLEITLKDLDQVSIINTSEKAMNLDLNGDGDLQNSINTIKRRSHFVGDASDIKLEHMLYPENTEFLHTVRYIALDEEGKPYNAPRMKELRYMKKVQFKSRQALSTAYYREAKEKDDEKLPLTIQIGDRGIDNGFGWIINGYIEDKAGQLRQQHEQELEFCNGCHKTVGSTFDQTFSFARKLEGQEGWGYIDLKKMKDTPNIGQVEGEYLTYMERVNGGDEFRQNGEMKRKWFNSDGTINKNKVENVSSIYNLIMPSAERAQKLNKAYKTIVDQQSYIYGRDANIKENTNVLLKIEEDQAPLKDGHRYQWDMRLNWDKSLKTTPIKISQSE